MVEQFIERGPLLFYDYATKTYFESMADDIRRSINNINSKIYERYDPFEPKCSELDILDWITNELGLDSRTDIFYRLEKIHIPWYQVDCDWFVCMTDSGRPCIVMKWILYYCA